MGFRDKEKRIQTKASWLLDINGTKYVRSDLNGNITVNDIIGMVGAGLPLRKTGLGL